MPTHEQRRKATERQRRYRARLRQDPEAWAAFCARRRRYYAALRASPERWARQLAYQAAWRERARAQRPPRPVPTPAELEQRAAARRAKRAAARRAKRAAETPEQRAARRARAREYMRVWRARAQR